jgi:hypothetical protein
LTPAAEAFAGKNMFAPEKNVATEAVSKRCFMEILRKRER